MIEVKQDWGSYFCLVEDNHASIRINLALEETASTKEYNQRTWFSVKLLNPDENGFTTQEEFPVICKIEDDILEALEKNNAIFVGALKTNGMFDMYLYSKDTAGYEEIISSAMNKYPDYQFATDSREDIEWSDYFDFLYPGEYEYQTIQNQKFLLSLQEHGDNPEKEREVDHWIYFKTEEDRDNYIKKVEELGYKILSAEKAEEGDFPFQLNISRQNNTNWSDVNEYVWELKSIASENNGEYDGWGCPIVKE